MGAFDYLFIIMAFIIWLSLGYNLVLMFFGYRYFLELKKIENNYHEILTYYPFVSIIIPAHNEEKVIEDTLKSIEKLDYPKENIKVIVVNDNSSDNTKEIFENFVAKGNRNYFHLVETTKEKGGKGKSSALNFGMSFAEGEYIVVYDADNTPESKSLRILVKTIVSDPHLGAVVGKFRTRNKNKNILTKFINIEGLSFQWLAQGGRWRLFELSTIPGTNYIINKKILESLGGFDPRAIAEDTEISIKLYKNGYKTRFMPLAVTWEQEPETLKVFIKQRTRWIKGNLYVLFKYFWVNPFNKNNRYFPDIFNFFITYILFLFAVLISDTIFIINLVFGFHLNVVGSINFIWFLTFILFILQGSITVSFEKGELNRRTFLLIVLSYFTYCQLWLYIAVKALFSFTKDTILKIEHKWYKTERF